MLGNRNFYWNFLPANGSAGGILVGVNGNVFYIIASDIRKVSVVVKIRKNDVVIRMTSVYGSPYEDEIGRAHV